MRKATLLLLIAFFSLLLLGLHVGIKKEPDPAELERITDTLTAPAKWQGRIAPDFALETIDGATFRLSDHIGREVVLLNFFATWCQPCRAEMPELVRFQGEKVGQPFLLIAIDAGEEKTLVQTFVDEFHMKFSVGIDRGRKTQRQFGVTAYPTSVLIGADGRVGLYENGAIMNTDVGLKKLVETQVEAIRAGKGISQEAYRNGAAMENYRDVMPRAAGSEIALQGRAQKIAEAMDCLCGCSSKVAVCACATSTRIKKKLKAGDFGAKTDTEIITELGKEFCVKGT